ncbi:MAG TPA: HNH endonuclease [Alicyclobacillus sp.]|nr:HNH endonuclease [Alicyclobacillus sp.]
MAARNPPWSRDELILALDLYFRHNPLHISENHKEVVALSNLLKQLPIHGENIADPDKFRNPAGVYMKMCNFLRFDPSYSGKGLDAGSRMDQVVWNEFAKDLPRLREVAAAIRNGVMTAFQSLAAKPQTMSIAKAVKEATEGEEFYPEGKIIYRIHRSRERNPKIVQKKKEQALKLYGVLRCEVCDFVYAHKYGELGKGFIECHHRTPVSQMKPDQKTTLADLALVCANCHCMLHRGGEVLSVEVLRDIVSRETKKKTDR